MHRLAGGLLLEQYPAYLRPVAVSDHDLPSGLGDVGYGLSGLARRAFHLLEGIVGAAAEQGVAAEGHNDPFHRNPFLCV